MDNLIDLIYENNSLEISLCDEIIDLFNNTYEKQLSISSHNDNIKTISIEVSFTTNDDKYSNIIPRIIDEINKHLSLYYNKLGNDEFYKDFINKKKMTKNFTIKKFLKSKISENYENNYDINLYTKKTKILNFIWYLNDYGKIEFFDKYKFNPKKGTIMIFPSDWFFPYCNISYGIDEPVILYGSIYIDIDM